MSETKNEKKIRDMKKMKNILKEQLDKAEISHNNDLISLKNEFEEQKKVLENEHSKKITELQKSIKENEDTILSILEEAETKKGGVLNDLKSVLDDYEHNPLNNSGSTPKRSLKSRSKYY